LKGELLTGRAHPNPKDYGNEEDKEEEKEKVEFISFEKKKARLLSKERELEIVRKSLREYKEVFTSSGYHNEDDLSAAVSSTPLSSPALGDPTGSIALKRELDDMKREYKALQLQIKSEEQKQRKHVRFIFNIY
jgi:hypothetical protein